MTRPDPTNNPSQAVDGLDLPRNFHLAPAKLHHGLLLAAVLAVTGLAALWLAPATLPDAEWLAVVNLGLAAAVAVMVFRMARDRRPRLIVDAEGVWYRDWDIERVPWRAIAGCHLHGSRLQTFACIELHEPDAWLAALPEDQRSRCRKNRLLRPPCLLVPNGALNAPLAQITALVEAARKRQT